MTCGYIYVQIQAPAGTNDISPPENLPLGDVTSVTLEFESIGPYNVSNFELEVCVNPAGKSDEPSQSQPTSLLEWFDATIKTYVLP